MSAPSKKVITFHYTLTNSKGEKLDSTEGSEPMTFLCGVEQIIPCLEAELLRLKVGEKKKVEIKSADAYGPRDPKKLIEVPIDRMPKKNIKVGEQLYASEEPSAPLTVTKVTATHVTMDANHPLADMDLIFSVELTAVRDASEEELSHGHVHGPGGHHHH